MKLEYYKRPNFGDALNSTIFHKLLPDFFGDDPECSFFGIGSIIGLPIVADAYKKIIFSSGFAYCELPKLDNSYDIICVRGPLSAKALKIDDNLGIADGALLLREFKYENVEKEYDFSFMPHRSSEHRYPWDKICKEAGIHFMSTAADPEFVIQEILKSKCVIAEAMHYAIVADILRVPWIPVKAYSTINDFKWQDWASSLEMNYDPISLAALYPPKSVKNFLKRKSPANLPEPVYDLIASARTGYENLMLKDKAMKGLERAKETPPQLSKDTIFNSKVDQLRERLAFVEKKYK